MRAFSARSHIARRRPTFVGSATNEDAVGPLHERRGQGCVKTVSGNRVGGVLKCENNEEPFVGAPNFAAKAEGQCSNTGPLP
jgi:hypothetical protein